MFLGVSLSACIVVHENESLDSVYIVSVYSVNSLSALSFQFTFVDGLSQDPGRDARPFRVGIIESIMDGEHRPSRRPALHDHTTSH